MNEAIVPVADHSAEARQEAFEEAYADVLVKQSDDPAIMTLPIIQSSLATIQDLVERYAYLEEPLRLQVVFDAASIHHILKTLMIDHTNQKVLFLKVTHINDFDDYQNITHILKHIPGVNEVIAERITGHSAFFRIKMNGNPEALIDELKQRTAMQNYSYENVR